MAMWVTFVCHSFAFSFYHSLNSQDNLCETLNGREGVVTMLTQLEVHTGTAAQWEVHRF